MIIRSCSSLQAWQALEVGTAWFCLINGLISVDDITVLLLAKQYHQRHYLRWHPSRLDQVVNATIFMQLELVREFRIHRIHLVFSGKEIFFRLDQVIPYECIRKHFVDAQQLQLNTLAWSFTTLLDIISFGFGPINFAFACFFLVLFQYNNQHSWTICINRNGLNRSYIDGNVNQHDTISLRNMTTFSAAHHDSKRQ